MKERSDITVTISGAQGVGKTTVGNYLTAALIGVGGYKVIHSDDGMSAAALQASRCPGLTTVILVEEQSESATKTVRCGVDGRLDAAKHAGPPRDSDVEMAARIHAKVDELNDLLVEATNKGLTLQLEPWAYFPQSLEGGRADQCRVWVSRRFDRT